MLSIKLRKKNYFCHLQGNHKMEKICIIDCIALFSIEELKSEIF